MSLLYIYSYVAAVLRCTQLCAIVYTLHMFVHACHTPSQIYSTSFRSDAGISKEYHTDYRCFSLCPWRAPIAEFMSDNPNCR